MSLFHSKTVVASLLLRIGLAFVLLYAAIGALQHPNEWIGYLPRLVTDHFPAQKVLDAFSIGQIVMALWLLVGKFLKVAATLTALALLGIIVFNMNAFIVTFRDIGLLFMAIALLFLDG